MKDLVRNPHREGKKSRSKIILQEDKLIQHSIKEESKQLGTHTILHNFSEKEKAKLIEQKAQEIKDQFVQAYVSRLKYVTPEEIKKARSNIPWREHMTVTSDKNVQLTQSGFNDDIQREIQFYNITLENMQKAIVGLTSEGIPVQRPPSYEYEMFKANLEITQTDNKLVKQQNRVQNVDEKQLRQQGKALQNLIKQKKIKDLHKGKNNNRVLEEWQKQINQDGKDQGEQTESHDPRKIKNLRENKFKQSEKEDRGYGIERKQIFKKGVKQLKVKRPGKISRMRTKSKLSSMKQQK